MIDHVEQRGAQAGMVEGEHAEYAKSKVRDGGIGDEFFDVALYPGGEGGIDDPDECEDGDEGRRGYSSIGQHG